MLWENYCSILPEYYSTIFIDPTDSDRRARIDSDRSFFSLIFDTYYVHNQITDYEGVSECRFGSGCRCFLHLTLTPISIFRPFPLSMMCLSWDFERGVFQACGKHNSPIHHTRPSFQLQFDVFMISRRISKALFLTPIESFVLTQGSENHFRSFFFWVYSVQINLKKEGIMILNLALLNIGIRYKKI